MRIRLTVFRWLRDQFGDAAMSFAWRVEQLERPARDRRHARERRAADAHGVPSGAER